MKSKVESVTMHADSPYSEAHPAVNVKVYGGLPEIAGASETQTKAAWELTVEQFWADAKTIAQKSGFSGVHSEGRSGGWLVPYLSAVPSYPGRTVYPDPHNPKERRQFLRFEAKVKELLAEAVGRFPVSGRDSYYYQTLAAIMEADRDAAERNWKAEQGTARNRYA